MEQEAALRTENLSVPDGDHSKATFSTKVLLGKDEVQCSHFISEATLTEYFLGLLQPFFQIFPCVIFAFWLRFQFGQIYQQYTLFKCTNVFATLFSKVIATPPASVENHGSKNRYIFLF